MHERIPITATALWAERSVDADGPITHVDVAKEIWQALMRKPLVTLMCHPLDSSCRAAGCGASIPWPR